MRQKHFWALLFVCGMTFGSLSAQSLGDLYKKSKEKVKEATQKVTGNSPGPTYYRFIRVHGLKDGKQVVYLSGTYQALVSDPKPYIEARDQFMAYVVSQYGVTLSVSAGPNVVSVDDQTDLEKSIAERKLALSDKLALVTETTWTYDGAPIVPFTQTVAGAVPAASTATAPVYDSVTSEHTSASRTSSSGVAFNTEQDGYLVAERYRILLLRMRDHPDLVNACEIDLAKWLVMTEEGERRDQDKWAKAKLTSRMDNIAHPVFTAEWSELMKSNPELAKNQILDIYLRPDADLSVFRQMPGWVDGLNTWADVFLFPKDQVQGRDPAFAAHDLAPMMKEQLQLAAHRESPQLWFQVPNVSAKYDIDSESLIFAQPLAQKLDLALAGGRTAYALPSGNVKEIQNNISPNRSSLAGIQRWREMLGCPSDSSGVILDHPLPTGPVKVDRRRAETMGLASGAGLTVRIFVDIKGTQDSPKFPKEWLLDGHLARIQVVTHKGEVVVEVPGNGGRTNSGHAEVKPATPSSAGVNAQAETSPALTKAIKAEFEGFEGSCKKNRLLSGNLDCACYADHMNAARMKQSNKLAYAGGSYVLAPDVSHLFPEADLPACSSEDRVKSEALGRVQDMHISPGIKAKFEACVPSAVAQAVSAQPMALYDIRTYNNIFSRASSDCQTGH